jgi:hypothetical protein
MTLRADLDQRGDLAERRLDLVETRDRGLEPASERGLTPVGVAG